MGTKKKIDERADEVGADEVQEKVDEAEAQGFIGSTPDATPNRNYSVEGVAAGLPTPETTEPEGK